MDFVDAAIADFAASVSGDEETASIVADIEVLETGKQDARTSTFIQTLFSILDEPMFNNVISFGSGGDSILIKNPEKFAKFILPEYFKHGNISSFVRQLNKYDFHKVKMDPVAKEQGWWEFAHPDFKSSNRELTKKIRRKPSAKRNRSRRSISTAAGGPGPSSPYDQVGPLILPDLPKLQTTSLLSPMGNLAIPAHSHSLSMPTPVTNHSPMRQQHHQYQTNSNQPQEQQQQHKSSLDNFSAAESMRAMKRHIDDLTAMQSQLTSTVLALTSKYTTMLNELEAFKRQVGLHDETLKTMADILIYRSDGGTVNSNGAKQESQGMQLDFEA